MYTIHDTIKQGNKLTVEYSGNMIFNEMKDVSIELKLKHKNVTRIKFYKLYNVNK